MTEQTGASKLRLGLVGYGMGGRIFHAPFIEAAEGIDLVGVVTRNEQRRNEIERDFPGMPVYDSLTALLDAGVEAVTITTPPQTRRELVLEAIERGVAVVADKPFAPSAEAARELVDAAAAKDVPLAVFHNRRWDTDLRTLKALIDSGQLGEVWRVESRFDLDEAHTIDPGPDGGLLRDLGTHLVDQMLWLLGPVTTVFAHLDYLNLPEGRTDVGFLITLLHESGAASTVRASKANHTVGKELRVYASRGGYHSEMSDVQAAAVFGGQRPVHLGDSWGYETEERWGTVATGDGRRPVPSARGAYQDYYTQFARAVHGDGEMPVTGAEAVALLRVLDAARKSAETSSSVEP